MGELTSRNTITLRLKRTNTQLGAIADGVQAPCASTEAPTAPGRARTSLSAPDRRPHRAQAPRVQRGQRASSVLKGELFVLLASAKANKTTQVVTYIGWSSSFSWT